MQSVRLAAWVIILTLAAAQTWSVRFDITPDGIAYLDMSDGVVEGRWNLLVNAYWSPLYPALVGIARRLVNSSAYWEVPVLHGLNLILTAAALGGFEYFLGGMSLVAQRWNRLELTRWGGRVAAYTAFAVCTLVFIPATLPTPDMLVNAIVFVAFGALLRVILYPQGRATVLLGLALGVGVLAKSFLVPWSLVCLVTVAIMTRSSGSLPAFRGAAVWLVIVVPWVITLSLSVGRFTTGDTGRLTYAWFVNQAYQPSSGVMPPATHTPSINPKLPKTGITQQASGTNPVWFDPARWYQSVNPRFDPAQQWRVLKFLGPVLVVSLAPLISLLVFAIIIADPESRRSALRRSWPVAAPSLAAILAYSLVLVTLRYIAPFVAALAIVLWLAVDWPRHLPVRRVLVAAIVPVLAIAASPGGGSVLGVQAAIFMAVVGAWWQWGKSPARVVLGALLAALVTRALLPTSFPGLAIIGSGLAVASLGLAADRAERLNRPTDFARCVRASLAATTAVVLLALSAQKFVGGFRPQFPRGMFADPNAPWAIAQTLQRLGLEPGGQVAIVGSPFEAYWARAARVQIVAVVPTDDVDAFWLLSGPERDAVLAEFAARGAAAVVAISPPDSSGFPEGWQRTMGGGFRKLGPTSSSPPGSPVGRFP